MNKQQLIEGFEYELEELKKQQRDFVRELNDFYGACVDEHNPPIDLLDLFEDGILNMSVFEMFPSEIVQFLKWHSRGLVISSIESIIDYIKQTEPRYDGIDEITANASANNEDNSESLEEIVIDENKSDKIPFKDIKDLMSQIYCEDSEEFKRLEEDGVFEDLQPATNDV